MMLPVMGIVVVVVGAVVVAGAGWSGRVIAGAVISAVPVAEPVQDSIVVGVAPLADVSPATVGSSPMAIGTATIDSWPVTVECA